MYIKVIPMMLSCIMQMKLSLHNQLHNYSYTTKIYIRMRMHVLINKGMVNQVCSALT